MATTSAGSPSTGISRGQVSVGRRPSPGSANGRRYCTISSAERVRRIAFGRICSTKKLSRRTIVSAGLGTQPLQGCTHVELVPVVPALRHHDRLHIRDTLYSLAVAVAPVEAEGRTPVMDNEGDPLVYIQVLEQGVEVATVFDEAIRSGAAVRQLVGVAHADQVRGDAAASSLQVRQHVAPKVRRGGVTVQQHDGVAITHLHIRHLAVEDRRRSFLYGNAAEILFASN